MVGDRRIPERSGKIAHGPPRGGQLIDGTASSRVYNPNTNSTAAWRCSLSSGVLIFLSRACGLGPDTMATYCLPPTSKVIGGAEKPEPILTLHNCSRVVSSNAAKVPSV